MIKIIINFFRDLFRVNHEMSENEKKVEKIVSNNSAIKDEVVYNKFDVVRVKKTARVANRYLGRKGIIEEFNLTERLYLGLRIHDRVNLLWVLESEVDKVANKQVIDSKDIGRHLPEGYVCCLEEEEDDEEEDAEWWLNNN